MRSAARCTYTEVARVLDGEKVPDRERFRAGVRAHGGAAGEAHRDAPPARRDRLRPARGEDRPRAGTGEVAAIEKRPRNRAHRDRRGVHARRERGGGALVRRARAAHHLPRPRASRTRRSSRPSSSSRATHGFEVPELPADPRALNALLERFKGHAQQRALNQLLLRAMMQAVYTTENIGHYGLAAEHYLHFTSPIRRYPDLLVHRLLKEEWARRQGDAVRRTARPRLEELAVRSSERERAAMEAEREIASFYAALFMKDKVGERFDGVVSAVVDFGLFVELERWFVEGLVRVEDLGGAVRASTRSCTRSSTPAAAAPSASATRCGSRSSRRAPRAGASSSPSSRRGGRTGPSPASRERAARAGRARGPPCRRHRPRGARPAHAPRLAERLADRARGGARTESRSERRGCADARRDEAERAQEHGEAAKVGGARQGRARAVAAAGGEPGRAARAALRPRGPRGRPRGAAANRGGASATAAAEPGARRQGEGRAAHRRGRPGLAGLRDVSAVERDREPARLERGEERPPSRSGRAASPDGTSAGRPVAEGRREPGAPREVDDRRRDRRWRAWRSRDRSAVITGRDHRRWGHPRRLRRRGGRRERGRGRRHAPHLPGPPRHRRPAGRGERDEHGRALPGQLASSLAYRSHIADERRRALALSVPVAHRRRSSALAPARAAGAVVRDGRPVAHRLRLRGARVPGAAQAARGVARATRTTRPRSGSRSCSSRSTAATSARASGS